MAEKLAKYGTQAVEDVIIAVRGQRVILDADLARLYGVETKRLNEQVRRNARRFPADFVFQLTAEEAMYLRSQFATSIAQSVADEKDTANRSQFATGSQNGSLRCQIGASKGRGGRRYLPYVFTEHGAIMAANVLNSRQAVEMSVFVVRAFIKMREHLLNRAELEKRLAVIEKLLLSHDQGLRNLYQRIRPLLVPPPAPQRKPIGFGVRERRAEYKAKRGRPLA